MVALINGKHCVPVGQGKRVRVPVVQRPEEAVQKNERRPRSILSIVKIHDRKRRSPCLHATGKTACPASNSALLAGRLLFPCGTDVGHTAGENAGLTNAHPAA